MERSAATTLKGNPLTVLGPELKVGDKAPDFEAVDNGLKVEEETGKLPNVSIYTFSMDLPFAQKRWCGAFGVDHVKMVSDHKTGSFGQAYGTLIKDLRILSRAIFVVGKDNTIKYVEYVKEVGDHPKYEAALAAAKAIA
jgi:thiol peroxidase